MQTSSYVKTSRELRSLHAVLKEWTRLNRNLGRQWSQVGDLPWWYNERALLSLFAGAIWRTGGHAFEEFSETKFKGTKKKGSNGRVDLWFENAGGAFRAEIKDAEIPIIKEGKQLRRLRKLMGRAVDDARCNPAEGSNSRRLAIAFAVPYLRAETPQKDRQDQTKRFLSLVKKVEFDAIAWTFPSMKVPPVYKGWICPSIVVMIKLVKRSL